MSTPKTCVSGKLNSELFVAVYGNMNEVYAAQCLSKGACPFWQNPAATEFDYAIQYMVYQGSGRLVEQVLKTHHPEHCANGKTAIVMLTSLFIYALLHNRPEIAAMIWDEYKFKDEVLDAYICELSDEVERMSVRLMLAKITKK